MSTLSKKTLVATVNAIVKPKVKKGELHTLTHKIVRLEVEKRLGLDEGTASSPEYKATIKEATEEAMNETPSDVDETGAKEGSDTEVKKSKSRKTALAKKDRKTEGASKNDKNLEEHSSPISSFKRKRPSGSGSNMETSSGRKAGHAKKATSVGISDDEEGKGGEEDEEYEVESEGVSSKKALPKSKSKVVKKVNPEKAVPAPKSRKQSRQVKDKEELDDAMEVEGNSEDDEPGLLPPPMKSKTKQELSKLKGKGQVTPTAKPQSRTKSAVQTYKSAEHIASSDMGDDKPDKPIASPRKPSPKKQAPAPHKPKKPPAIVPTKAGSESEDSPPSKRMKRDPNVQQGKHEDKGEIEKSKGEETPKASKKPPPTKADNPIADGDDSETGLSDLIDEPPKRKKQTKSTEKAPKGKEKATTKHASSSKPTLSKDEETIKRLKSLVLACGVRKVWAKLFKDVGPKAQITKLKEMLADLGMSGRYTLEKAKEIKQKREFEKELEDVQEFAKSMQERESRSTGNKPLVEESESMEESETEEVVVPRRRSGNARNSIAAFLQEQSDSD